MGDSRMNISVLGVDIAKNIFQLHGVDSSGKCSGLITPDTFIG